MRLLHLCLVSGFVLAAASTAQDKPPQPHAPTATAGKSKSTPSAADAIELGQRIDGELSLRDIDGQEQKAKDLMGKVTVINFYSIQCPVQAQWDERLAQIQKDFAEQGVVFLHIDSNVTEIGEKAPEQPSLRDMPPHSPRSRRCRRPLAHLGSRIRSPDGYGYQVDRPGIAIWQPRWRAEPGRVLGHELVAPMRRNLTRKI